jgi:hypothetical protein
MPSKRQARTQERHANDGFMLTKEIMQMLVKMPIKKFPCNHITSIITIQARISSKKLRHSSSDYTASPSQSRGSSSLGRQISPYAAR